MATGEIQPAAIKIDRIVERIREGDIKIPAFQRGFVWNQDQVIALLDSVYQNFPIGSILLWSSHERLKSTRNIAGLKLPNRVPEYPVNYVLDGQQRLSCLFAAFSSQRDFEAPREGYPLDPSVFDLSFRFDDEAFIPSADCEAKRPSIKLSSLLDTEILLSSLESLGPDLQKAARRLHSRIINYEIPVVTISKRTKDEVGVIFERINSTGTRLTTLDLLVAWTWSEEFHLQESLNELAVTLDSKGFAEVPDKVILQCLGAILAADTKTKTILALDPDEVRNNFAKIGASVSAAADFLSTEFRMQSLELLPHLQQIVVLAYFFDRTPLPTAEQINLLKKWFWKTSFSRRYSAQTDEKMNADIAFMKRISSGETSGISEYTADISKPVLLRLKFTKVHPYTRALLLLLAQKAPLNLTNGGKIDIGEALSSFNRKEYHHIFPRAFLKNRGVSEEKINSICNFCFLPAGSNKKISNKQPSDYVFSLVPAKNRKEILKSNLMPLRMEVYSNDDYDEFLNLRADIIGQAIDSLVV